MSDPYWANVTFLAGFEGGSPTDEGPLAQTVTTYNSTATSATQFKFGSKSLAVNEFDGAISVPHDASIFEGTESFTIELFMRLSSLPTTLTYFASHCAASNSNQSWDFFLDKVSSNYRLGMVTSTDGTAFTSAYMGDNNDFSLSVDTWYHVAVDFDGSKYRFYLDGVMVDSSTTVRTIPSVTAPLLIGCRNPTPSGAPFGAVSGYLDEVRITSGVARYASDGGFTVPTAAFDRVDPLDVTITAGLSLTDAIGTGGVFLEPVTVSIAMTGAIVPGWLRTAGDNIHSHASADGTRAVPIAPAETVNLTGTPASSWGHVCRETLSLLGTWGPTVYYRMTLGDSLQIAAALIAGRPVTAAESLNLTAAIAGVQALVVAEQVGLSNVVLPALRTRTTVAEAVRLSDALHRFFGADVSEHVALSAEVLERLQAQVTASESTVLSATPAPVLLLRVTAAETLELTAETLLQMIWSGQLAETLELAAGYLAPGGDFTTWAMNTHTGAVTEYSNYAFNSFARIGNKYLAASDSGLYELLGDDDAGTAIISRLKSGLMQFGGTHLSRLKDAYLAARGGGQFVLKIVDGDGAEYVYQVDARDMRSTKVHMGKGQRSRYFAFELTSAGQDFDIETLEFVPIVVQRRV